MTLTIGFDALIYGWPPGGIATYQTQLMAALKQEEGIRIAFSGGYGEGPPGVKRRFIGRRRTAFAANMARAAFWKSDIHHSTAFWQPPMLNAKARVLTVHDMIPEKWGDRFPAIAGAHYAKRRLAARADAIVVPSRATRDDVLELWKLPEDRVIVTPEAAAPSRIVPGGWFAKNSGRYVLIVGRRGHYKNVLPMIPAIGRALSADPSLMLVLAGGGKPTDEERAALAGAGLAARTAQTQVSDDELIAAYAHAICLIAPSLAEGFGLPVLEAMQYGAPVVASAIAAQREVAGEAALWFDPADGGTLEAQLVRVLHDETLRESLRLAGRAQAAGYSWQATAAATAAVYRMVAGR
ncbi:MAG: glycosyltransferase family 1 protein [Micropepsaceae bacterium]